MKNLRVFSLEEKRKEEGKKKFRYCFKVKMLFKSQFRRGVGIVYIKADCGRQEKIKDG